MENTHTLIDAFHRKVDYVRISVTDRCDFRCTYCMAEEMTFLPRDHVLSLEELGRLAKVFRQLGVRKLRITGGEPLIRRDILNLFHYLGSLQFDDLSVTTNGSHLTQYARALVDSGVHRVNISLDSLKPDRFRAMTRTGDLNTVLAGISAAQQAGFKRIKLNCVVLKHHNADEISSLVDFALANGLDISFIEEMPLGEIASHQRHVEFVSSADVRAAIQQRYALEPIPHKSSGPSKYWSIPNYNSRIGFISPHSENFCATCNRVRVSAEGRLLLCLGNEHSVDLRKVLREHPATEYETELKSAIMQSMVLKPEKHHFQLDDKPQILRFMNATGG